MAHMKNSDRRKRKYGDKQKARTARNKVTKKAAAQLRAEKLVLRTFDLEGERVRYGTKDGRPLLGRVTAILRPGDENYPKPKEDTNKPHGSYLVIEDRPRDTTTIRARRRVKPVYA
jgi:hypothetical protein